MGSDGGGRTARIFDYVERQYLFSFVSELPKRGFSSKVRKVGEESLAMTVTKRALKD